MNKQELIAAIATQTEVSKKVVQQVVEALVDTVVGAISDQDKVNLTGLGTFGSTETAARAERQGRNPSTGDPITIAATEASRKPTFAYAPVVKRTVKESV